MALLRKGDKVTLWNGGWDRTSTKSEHGFRIEGVLITHELVVTVTSVDKVPGMWSRKETYTGYTAVDEQGGVWTLFHPSYPDDAMSPMHDWAHESGPGDFPWMRSAVERLAHGDVPIRPDGTFAKPIVEKICRKCNKYPFYRECFEHVTVPRMRRKQAMKQQVSQ